MNYFLMNLHPVQTDRQTKNMKIAGVFFLMSGCISSNFVRISSNFVQLKVALIESHPFLYIVKCSIAEQTADL